VFLKNQPKIILMHTLKKPFTLLLILSHLNAFVLGGVSNVKLVVVVYRNPNRVGVCNVD
jgi:hypothetical protein